MTKSIENGNWTVPSQYEKLVTIDPATLKEMSKKSISVIMMEAGLAQFNLCVKGKRMHYEIKMFEQGQDNASLKKMLEEYDRYSGVVSSYLTAGASFGSAYCGGPNTPGGMLFGGVSQVIGQTEKRFDEQSQARIKSIEHRTNTLRGLITDSSSELREEDKSFEQTLNAMNAFHQSEQRTFDSVGSH